MMGRRTQLLAEIDEIVPGSWAHWESDVLSDIRMFDRSREWRVRRYTGGWEARVSIADGASCTSALRGTPQGALQCLVSALRDLLDR